MRIKFTPAALLLVVAAMVVVLAAPAAAAARTPVHGAAKMQIVTNFTFERVLNVDQAQERECFNAYTDGPWALVVVTATRRTVRWFEPGGRCYIQAYQTRQKLVAWQPDGTIMRHTSRGWEMTLQFDEATTAATLRKDGIPVGVFRDLTDGQPVD